jgi:hypothetical protein
MMKIITGYGKLEKCLKRYELPFKSIKPHQTSGSR